jgi:hypothetical protein
MVKRFNDNPFCIATRGGTISAHSKKGFYLTNKRLRMTVMDDSAIFVNDRYREAEIHI